MITHHIPKQNTSHDVDALLKASARCRRLACSMIDRNFAEDLINLADDYEDQAVAIVDAYIFEKRNRDK
jgi:basic membrane lipoprotein Med (substrate-binding protein (PBP1-ABC) superfamily)